jgi:hypothetical protein
MAAGAPPPPLVSVQGYLNNSRKGYIYIYTAKRDILPAGERAVALALGV